MTWSLPLLLGALAGGLALLAGVYVARRSVQRTRESARRMLADAVADAEAKSKEVLVSAQEKILAGEEEADRRDRELDARDAQSDARAQKLDQDAQAVERKDKELERRRAAVARTEESAKADQEAARTDREAARLALERNAGLTIAEARAELIAGIEEEARKEAARLARRIEDEARENAEREATNLIVQATQRVNTRDVVETTVSLIELPNDELKGRIIGREGRNIRALEMTTGIDLIVDDTPRAILISSFDPMRREVAKIAIGRLVEDGRIHPARIEEVVTRVRAEMETIVEEAGTQAAFNLGVTDLHPRLARLVGKLKYQTNHGQNLLQHFVEVTLIAVHMAGEIGGRDEVVRRAGLPRSAGGRDREGAQRARPAELAARFGESEGVRHATQSLHPSRARRRGAPGTPRTACRMRDPARARRTWRSSSRAAPPGGSRTPSPASSVLRGQGRRGGPRDRGSKTLRDETPTASKQIARLEGTSRPPARSVSVSARRARCSSRSEGPTPCASCSSVMWWPGRAGGSWSAPRGPIRLRARPDT
jgi:ribonuclease Y